MKKQFMQFLVRVLANGCALFIAAQLFEKITYQDHLIALAVASVMLSVINVVVKPLVVILALPMYVVTLGLFSIIVNGAMLYLVDVLYRPFEIQGVGTALLAGTMVGLVNYIVTRAFDSVRQD